MPLFIPSHKGPGDDRFIEQPCYSFRNLYNTGDSTATGRIDSSKNSNMASFTMIIVLLLAVTSQIIVAQLSEDIREDANFAMKQCRNNRKYTRRGALLWSKGALLYHFCSSGGNETATCGAIFRGF